MFVPWEKFLSLTEEPTSLWTRFKSQLPDRLQTVVQSTSLLHRTKEDAQRDARMWNSRGEDAGELTDLLLPEPGNVEERSTGDELLPEDWVTAFTSMVHNLTKDQSCVVQKSDVLQSLSINRSTTTNTAPRLSFADQVTEIYGDCGSCWAPDAKTALRSIQATNSQQLSANKLQRNTIESGESEIPADPSSAEEVSPGRSNNNEAYNQPVNPSVSLEFDSNTSFTSVGKAVATDFQLNARQRIALLLVTEALDRFVQNPEESEQYLGYLGGEGGTGKSRVIKAFYTVFEKRKDTSSIILTATSGAAAAEIGGTTYHSVLGMNPSQASRETRAPDHDGGPGMYKWKTKKMLVIDEVSMLGCYNLCIINDRLQQFRRSVDRGGSTRPFGGLPVVLFAGDFL